MKTLIFALLYLWQLPQNLLGLLLFNFKRYRPLREIDCNGRRVLVCGVFPGGISLGHYILVHDHASGSELCDTIMHEYGHSRQSAMLGWLYLPVIGLASGIHAAIHNYRQRKGLPTGNYYRFWPEAWANRLGGIPNYGS